MPRRSSLRSRHPRTDLAQVTGIAHHADFPISNDELLASDARFLPLGQILTPTTVATTSTLAIMDHRCTLATTMAITVAVAMDIMVDTDTMVVTTVVAATVLFPSVLETGDAEQKAANTTISPRMLHACDVVLREPAQL